MREIKIGDCSITFTTEQGITFDIETRKYNGIAVYQNGKKVFSRNAFGKNDLGKRN